MKKFKIGSFGAGFLCALVLTAGVFTAAAVATGTIDMNRINLSMDGQFVFSEEQFLELESGVKIPSSLSYVDETGGATTYLPLSYISKLLNVEVTWYGSDNAVVLGDNKTAVLDANISVRKLAKKWLIDGEYPKNSKGESYGPEQLANYVGYAPDLLYVPEEGDHPVGYYRQSERTAAETKMEGLSKDACPHTIGIPLYDAKGNVIGEYQIGCSGHIAGSGMSIEDAMAAAEKGER